MDINIIYLIKDADILMFRHPRFPRGGWWVARYCKSPYSHCCLAKWVNNELYVLEYRSASGPRLMKAEGYVNKKGRVVDVYGVNDVTEGNTYKTMNEHLRARVIREAESVMRKYTVYSRNLILRIACRLFPFVRLFFKPDTQDKSQPDRFICSTLVTYAYRKAYTDLIPNLSDMYSNPGDVGRSALLHLKLTLK